MKHFFHQEDLCCCYCFMAIHAVPPIHPETPFCVSNTHKRTVNSDRLECTVTLQFISLAKRKFHIPSGKGGARQSRHLLSVGG